MSNKTNTPVLIWQGYAWVRNLRLHCRVVKVTDDNLYCEEMKKDAFGDISWQYIEESCNSSIASIFSQALIDLHSRIDLHSQNLVPEDNL